MKHGHNDKYIQKANRKRTDLNICALCQLRLKFGLTEPCINRLDINSTKNIMREMVVYLFLPDDGGRAHDVDIQHCLVGHDDLRRQCDKQTDTKLGEPFTHMSSARAQHGKASEYTCSFFYLSSNILKNMNGIQLFKLGSCTSNINMELMFSHSSKLFPCTSS